MRLALVITSLSSGGAERVMSMLANYWALHGKVVTLITIASEDTDFYSINPDVKRVALGLIRPSHGVWSLLRNNTILVWQLRKAIQAARPDVIISFMNRTNVLTIVASRGLGVPVIVSERTDPEQRPIERLLGFSRDMMYRFADCIVVQSQRAYRWAQKVAKYSTIRVIPNPVLTPIANGKTGFSVASDRDLKILALGRLSQEKGFDLLIRAFAKVKPVHPCWRLIIMGEGEERAQLETLARSLCLDNCVEMPGRVKEPMKVMIAADLFVLPSRYEGFPNALLEAMACGLPVISFDCPIGPSEIIRDGVDGILVPPADVDALARAMDRLMSDTAERKRLGSRAIEVCERFSLNKVMGMWNDLLIDVMGKNRKGIFDEGSKKTRCDLK